MSPSPISITNKLLGYPDDARLLIINGDDLGMSHAINTAIFHAIKEGVVSSTTLMVPCPLAFHAMNVLKENPDIGFGVHLTLIRDLTHHAWRPLTCQEKVPSLVDEIGYFYPLNRIKELVAGAKIDELEIEFRAQIDTVLAAGLKPTHLDWHCFMDGGRPDIFDLTIALAKEYGLALRVFAPECVEKVHNMNLPCGEHGLVDTFNVANDQKAAHYAQKLRELPIGLNEWAVHPGVTNEESKALDPHGWDVRQSDFDFLVSPEAKSIIEAEGIILLNFRPLQEMWKAHRK